MSKPNAIADRLYAQAVQAVKQADLSKAEKLLREAVSKDRRHATAWRTLGLLLARQKRLPEAVKAMSGAVKANPKDATAHFNLGNALKQVGDLKRAITAFSQAVKLAPQAAPARNGLGVALREAGRHQDAVTQLKRAIALDPNLADAHSNLGIALKEGGDPNAALTSYRRALAIDPHHVQALGNLGNALTEQGNFSAARDAYRSALAVQPDHPETHYNLANTLVEEGDLDQAEHHFELALGGNPDHPHAARNLLFMSCYNPRHTPEAVADRHREWGQHFKQISGTIPVAPYRNTPDPERCLKIGLVSADLKKHAVTFFIEPLLKHLNRQRASIHCYANVAVPDEHTVRLKGLADTWHDITKLGDAQAAELIRKDGIDVLIDLSGHTANSRLPLFRYRPAPIQAGYLGYPATTGTDLLDYRITDATCDPQRAQDWYTEKFAYVADGFCAFQPPENAPNVSPSPAQTNGFVTFGSLLNLSKVNQDVVALWASVLTAVPDSRLFMLRHNLAAEDTRTRYLNAFATHGIMADRITIAWEYEGSHLDQYRHMDISLDSLPFCSHTSNCEAQWMGVPTLTLGGDYFAGRMGLSINHMAGLDDWCANDPAEYLKLAKQKASDIPALVALRSRLRQQVAASRLCDGKTFANSFEATVRGLWQNWCREQ
jgi:predicted O-linked N-acetylglucosamine transferase (SPINDLY family)